MNRIAQPVQPARILLVDDDPALLEGLARLLKRQRMLCDTCTDAEAAWERLQFVPYDVICSDQHMPGGNGVDLLQRCARSFPSMHRILITGAATLDIALTAINHGQVHHLLRKPVAQDNLLRTLSAAVRTSRTNRLAKSLLQRCRQRELQLLALGAAPEIERPLDDDYLPDTLPPDFEDLLPLEMPESTQFMA